MELPNALFYNERTGEYFNPEFGSILPTVVGDVIQFASIVTNAASNLAKCDDLSEAPPSQTKLPLNFTFPDGTSQIYPLIGDTPSIKPNGQAYGVGRFQINGPGFINVQEVEADFYKNVGEFNENNNITQIGISTSIGGRISSSHSQPILEILTDSQLGISSGRGVKQLPINEPSYHMAIFRNMNTIEYSQFLDRIANAQARSN
jgi:hypothetical protein